MKIEAFVNIKDHHSTWHPSLKRLVSCNLFLPSILSVHNFCFSNMRKGIGNTYSEKDSCLLLTDFLRLSFPQHRLFMAILWKRSFYWI